MRIGGAFPFGQVAIPVALPSGGIFYPPAGNYMSIMGAQTIWQVFDPTLLSWRNVGTQFGDMPSLISCDGYNYRLVNFSGIMQMAAITNAGSGAVNGIGAAATGVSISFGAAPTNGVAAAAYPIVGGALSAFTIVNGGSGFTVPPLILIDPPPQGGIQATATSQISSAGVINAVNLVQAGAGYIAPPNVYVVPQYGTYVGIGVPVNPAGAPSIVPPGLINGPQPPTLPGINWSQVLQSAAGAAITANALTGSGTVTGIVMTNYGAGYAGTTIPTITISGAGAAAATAIGAFAVLSLGTGGTAGAAYTAGTPWISSLSPTGAATWFPTNNNNVAGPRPARGRLTSATGFTGTAAIVEDNGFALQGVVNIGTEQFGTLVTTVSTTTAVMGGITDTTILLPAVMD